MHEAGDYRQRLNQAAQRAYEPLECRQFLSASAMLVHWETLGRDGQAIDVPIQVARRPENSLSISAWSGELGPLPATVYVVGRLSQTGGFLPGSSGLPIESPPPTPFLLKPSWHPLPGESAVQPVTTANSWWSLSHLVESTQSASSAFENLSHPRHDLVNSDSTKDLNDDAHGSASTTLLGDSVDAAKPDVGLDHHAFGNFGHGIISLAELTKCGNVRIVQTINADFENGGFESSGTESFPGSSSGTFHLAGAGGTDAMPAGIRMPANDGPPPEMATLDHAAVTATGGGYAVIMLSGNLRNIVPNRGGELSTSIRPADMNVQSDGSGSADPVVPRPDRGAHHSELTPPSVSTVSVAMLVQGPGSVTPLNRSADAATAHRSSNAPLTDVDSRELSASARGSVNPTGPDGRAVHGPRTALADATPPEQSAPGARTGGSVAGAMVRLMSNSAGIQLFNAGTKILDILRLPNFAEPAATGDEAVDPQSKIDAVVLGLAPWRTARVKDETVDAVWRTIASVSLVLAIGGYWYCNTVAARRAELEQMTAKANRRLRATVKFSEVRVQSRSSIQLISPWTGRD